MLEKMIRKGIATSALLFGLVGCGDTIENYNYNYYGSDVKTTDVYIEKESSPDIFVEDISQAEDISRVRRDLTENNDLSMEEVYSGNVEVKEVREVEKTKNKITINDNYQCSDFSKFPDDFYEDGIFNGYFVVGENASTLDNLSTIDILTSMPYNIVDATKLDSEIADLSATNIISIGNPCNNSVTAELLGNPIDCSQGFYPGQGKIITLQHKGNDNLALIVAGYSGSDIRLTAKVIAKRVEELKEIGGCEITVEGKGSTYNDAEINSKK